MSKDKLIYASAARKAILDADPKLAYCIDSIPGVDVPKWISVKDGLPNKSMTFVVVADAEYGMPMRVVRGDSIKIEKIMGEPFGYFSHGVQCTHWMPLPEPPEEDHDE